MSGILSGLKAYKGQDVLRGGHQQVGQMMQAPLNQNTSKLVIIPRKKFAHQRVRPLKFNFSDEIKTSLAMSLDDSRPFSSLNMVNAGGIVPTSHGAYDVNMGFLQNTYSFLLMITTKGNSRMLPEKILYGGYFTDEPLSRNGSNPNPRAQFFITHSSILAEGNNKLNRSGTPLQILGDTLTLGREVETCLDTDHRLFWNTPTDVDSLPDRGSAADMSTILVENTLDKINIAKSSLVPAIMMNEIANNVKDFRMNRETMQIAMENYSPHHDSFNMPTEGYNFSHSLRDRLPGLSTGSSINNFSSAFDEKRVHTMEELLIKYPDTDIFMYDITQERVALGHEIDQEYDGIQNQLSYLISCAVEPMATNAGLLSVDFLFSSDVVHDGRIWMGKKNPQFIVNHAIPVLENVDWNMMKAIERRFESFMINNVFSTVTAALNGSDYECMVHYQHGQTCNVILTLHDHPRGCQDGYYESYGHISSVVAPTVGNIETIQQNSGQMIQLRNTILNM